ncbi:MerR family transcriptional regulator [Maledivibacter halophilus]|uniref:DNA-binding transcriptional regulator, MerR family n=1 Tax=Maledivibacter halophilus TaxID=36842 RepID=A0A1T5M8A2_9FIRM|nr:MerR family transcriptional regulator [Maledivibacter halophilus]SKC84471.1 DNA-binding transcriptional regulator, MerR family [Maledivibacter halophilus]
MKKEYTIGEICKLYNLGPDSIRYYEKKGLIFPGRRENGYRVYSIKDIWRLNIIKNLRKLNFSVKQIREYLEHRSVDTTIKFMEEEIRLIEKEIMPLIKLKENLQEKVQILKSLKKIEDYSEIKVQRIRKRKIILIKAFMTKDEEVDLAFRKLEGRDDSKLFLLSNKDMGVFISEQGFKKQNYGLYQNAFFFVDDKEENYNMILPEGYFVTLIYRGAYKKSQMFFNKMINFIKEKGYSLNGNAMEIYRLDIHETSKEEEFITEIQIPIKKD